MAGKPAKIIALDLLPGHPVGAQRHNGFMKGFGLPANEAEVERAVEGARDRLHGRQLSATRPRAQTAMENCLQKAPDVNLVYTINEPAAAGAYNALKRPARRRACSSSRSTAAAQGIKDANAGIDCRDLAAVPAEDGRDGRGRGRRIRQERARRPRAMSTRA